MTTDMPTQTVTICQCDGGVVAVRDGRLCLPEPGNLEEVKRRYYKDDVWFVELVGVNPAMLVVLAKSAFIQETLECLRKREPGRRCSYSELLAKEIAERAVVLEALRGSGNWRADLVSFNTELARIVDTGMIYEEE